VEANPGGEAETVRRNNEFRRTEQDVEKGPSNREAAPQAEVRFDVCRNEISSFGWTDSLSCCSSNQAAMTFHPDSSATD
jgi:hypothetical protein